MRPNPIAPPPPLPEHESSWRGHFWSRPVLIHGIIEIVLTILIIILEIASLGVSTASATGAGFWCAIPFLVGAIMAVMLVTKWNRSRVWATRVLIAQIILLIFSFILIGIDGSFISANSSAVSSYSAVASYGLTTNSDQPWLTKYRIVQAQLAFAILMMFAGFAYIIFYAVVTYLALLKPFGTLDADHLFRE